jgi:Mg-chelatase subunit ChlD
VTLLRWVLALLGYLGDLGNIWPMQSHDAETHGLHRPEVCLLLDASTSMKSTDMLPDRYQTACLAMKEFNRQRERVSPQTSLSISLFAGELRRIVAQCAVGEEADVWLERLAQFKPEGWTDFVAALGAAQTSFSPTALSKRVILCTDGHHTHGGPPEDAISLASQIKAKGIVIEAVGIGARGEVDEEFLLRLVSSESGTPCYRWVGDDGRALVEHFGLLARKDC